MSLILWQQQHNISADVFEDLRARLLEPISITELVVGSSEEGAQQRVRADAPQQCGILWRNNVGAYEDDRGVWVRYGLCNDSKKVNKKIKSSDLIGITMISYYGRCFGVFTAIEMKKPGWTFKGTEREEAQLKYHNIVRSYGGIAGFATCVEDYRKLLAEYLKHG